MNQRCQWVWWHCMEPVLLSAPSLATDVSGPAAYALAPLNELLVCWNRRADRRAWRDYVPHLTTQFIVNTRYFHPTVDEDEQYHAAP